MTCRYEENGYRNTSLFRVNSILGRDILTEELLSQEKIKRNPIIFDVRLTDEQVEQIKDGQPVYLEGMQHQGKTFDGYLVMDDNLTRGRAYIRHDPREWVEYGKYTMRRMDRDLIKGGFVVRALVQWWGGHGQTARPYLWQENPSDETYQESWDDPRKPRVPRHDTKQGRIVSSPKSLKVQSYNGRPGTKSPFHPNAKVWIEGICCKAIQSVPHGSALQLVPPIPWASRYRMEWDSVQMRKRWAGLYERQK